jgi:hypothetical protein
MQRLVSALSIALLVVSTHCAFAQQIPGAGPTPPAGSVEALAQRRPDAMVSMTAEFKDSTSSQQIADLVTAEKIPAASIVIRRPRGASSYESIGYSFSASEPRMDEQLARARCMEIYPAMVPIQSDPAFNATLTLTAAQAQRWKASPPPILKRITAMNLMSDSQLARAKELMHKVLTMRSPVPTDQPISKECSRFFSAK